MTQEIHTPDWVKNAVFYQIFPDRLDKNLDLQAQIWQSSNLESWESPPTLQGYKGGNLWGVIDQLDYLQDLGINAIYFTPIFQSACNHRYHTHDYYQVDPLLGGNVAFDALLNACHNRNIKVVLDGVFNHAGRGFFFFNDILENGPYSPWLDWFIIEDWPLSAYDGSLPANYVGWADNRALPQFNHDNPNVREYLLQIAEYWLNKGIDGWRLDVPFEIKVPGFWQEFRRRVKAINPDAYIVGEIWTEAQEWLDGTQFDGVMNYRFTEATIAFIAGNILKKENYSSEHLRPYPAISAEKYRQKIEHLLSIYPWEIQLTQLNLLDSHDTTRLSSGVNEDKSSIELATLLLFTFPGPPSVYYGDEVGLLGDRDPDCRRAFPSQENWDLEVLEYHKKLIALRHQYQALRMGTYQILYAKGSVYVFLRKLEQEEIIIGVNVSESETRVNFKFVESKTFLSQLIYGKGHLKWQEKQIELIIPPRQGCIFG